MRPDDGTRLLGFRKRWRSNQARRNALVILLHGWEGSSESNYLLAAARSLDAAGFDTFRPEFSRTTVRPIISISNFFHSCRLQEVLDVVRESAAGLHRGSPVFLVGFSLGGNFSPAGVARSGSRRRLRP